MASRLKADIVAKHPDADVELVEGSGGVFEVERDTELIFSKVEQERFPETEEILGKLSTARN